MLRTLSLLFAVSLVVAACGDDDGEDAGPAGTGDVALGAQVFDGASPACSSCHTLSAAGSEADIGPNLDSSFAPASFVEQTVRNGIGAMPAYEDQLSDDEIEAVASYVYANSAASEEP
jgi:mono/diheme cytochrome c family protein